MTNHILRECSQAKEVWNYFQPHLDNLTNNLLLGSHPLKDWLQANLTLQLSLFINIHWSTLFAGKL